MIKFYSPENYLVVSEYYGKIPMKCLECQSVGYKENEFGLIPCVCGQRICPKCKGRGEIDSYLCEECDCYGYQVAIPRFL